MAVNHDDEKRWVELHLEVPGTPEQVWQAVATGPGNSAWFTRTTIDGLVDGGPGEPGPPSTRPSGAPSNSTSDQTGPPTAK